MKDDNNKDKLEEIIKKFEGNRETRERWKKIIEENKEEFQNIKSLIRKKQSELKELVIKKQVGEINEEEFLIKLEEIQNELTELEFKIYNLRLKI